MKKLLVAMLAALMVFVGIASAETGTYAIHSHRPCGSGSCSHSAHSSSVTYQPLTKDNFSASISAANSTGYYYLAEDISMAYDVTIPETSSVYLCLNGHTIKSNQNSANAGYANLFVINGSLDLSDCQGTGAIDGNASSYWSTRIATVSGKFNMWSGTLQNGRKVQGGAIYVLPKSTAVFNMYGGTIKNCTADSEFAAFGGAIYAPGYTTDDCNNITADETTSCSVNIYGGTITGNTAEHSGGAIYASRAAKVYIQGGTISNNTCRYSGGSAIHYEAALRELSIGGVTIRGGTITGHSTGDAAVYIARDYNDTPTHDDLNMLGGSIIENSVTGLYTYHSRAYIDDASISFNGGWGIDTNNANVVLYDTTVTGNTSGGVDVYHSQLHLGGKMDISGNGNNTNVNLASGRLISMSYAPLTTGSKVGVTVAGKTSSNVVRFLTRPGGGSITEDYLVGFSSDQFYPMGIDSDAYGVMGTPVTVTANSSNTNHGTVTGGGTVNKGTQVFLTATAKEGYQFVNWTDANGDQVSTNAQFYYAANANATLTANFVKLITITTTVNAAEGGVVTDGVTVAQGSLVTMFATPNEGYLFVNWTDDNGNVVSDMARYSNVFHNDTTLTANFAYNISLLVAPHAAVDANCMALYAEPVLIGSGKTLTIKPSESGGYVFVNWTDESGNVVSTSKTYTFAPDRPTTLTANFALPVTVTAQSADATMGSASGTASVLPGTSVTVKATPAEGYVFVNWTDADGDVVSTDAEYTFAATETCTLTANFATIPMVTITVRSSDESLGEASVGTDGVKSITVRAGTEVTASTAKRNTDLVVFNGWYDSSDALLSTSAGYSFTAVQDMDLTAKFSLASNASVIRTHIVPEGAGTATGSGIFLLDSTVSFTATANEGYRFVNWTNVNGSEITASPSFRTSSGSKEIDLFANFRLLGPIYTITATPDNASHGTVSGAGEYEEGESVTVTATPKQGYRFLEWQENGATVENAGASYTFTVESARTLTAVFGPQQYGTLTINKQMNGATLDADLCYVTLNGQTFTSGTFGYGDTISLTPVFPEDHFECHGFQQQGHEDGYGGSDTFTFTMPEESNVVMNVYFFPRSFDINVTVEPAEAASATEIGGTGTGLYGADGQVTAYCYEGSGYVFYGWYDSTGTNLLSTNSSYDFVIDGKTDLIAKVVPSGEYVRIEAQPSDRDGASVSGSGTYQVGSTATLTVTTNSGYTFVGWEGNSHEEPFSTATSITVDVPDHNMYYTAIIAKDGETHTLNVSAENGSVVNENGVAYPATSEHESSKYVHLLPKPNDGYEFDHWEITEDRHSYTERDEDLALTMTHNWTVKAVFIPDDEETLFEFAISTRGSGEVESTHEPGRLPVGTEITLTAKPETDCTFEGWHVINMGNGSETVYTDETLTIKLTKDTEVLAEFSWAAGTTFNLSFYTYGEGYINTSHQAGAYAPGTEIELTAIPADGWRFSRWVIRARGGETREEISTTITLEADTEIHVEFLEGDAPSGGEDEERFFFDYRISEGAGTITANYAPEAQLPAGTQVTLKATPAEGYVFSVWVVETPDSSAAPTEIFDNEITITIQENTFAFVSFNRIGGGDEGGDEPELRIFEYHVSGNGTVESSHESGEYEVGTEISLTAIPADGTSFIKWVVEYPDLGSSMEFIAASLLIELSENTVVTAEFSAGGGIGGDSDTRAFEYSRSGNGSVVSSHENGNYAVGTEITLQAFPDVGAVFARWLVEFPDAGVSTEYTEESITIVLTENTVVVAQFADDGVSGGVGGDGVAQLFLLTDGNGRIECEYESGEFVPLGTPIPVTAIADEGFVFSHWVMEQSDISGAVASSEQSIEIILTTQTTLTAYFVDASTGVPDCELALATEGSGTLTGTSAGVYPPDTAIMLTAVPEDMWRVCAWLVTDLDTGDSAILETNQTEFTFVLRQNVLITVVFEPGYVIEAKANDEALGTVTGSGVYYAGEEVTLTATPADEQSLFTGWYAVNADGTINLYSEESELVFSPTSDLTLVAWFTSAEVAQYVINTTAVPEVGGLVTGEGFYDEGATVTLTATANDGYTFIGWYENNTAITTEATLTFTAESNRNIEARFDAIEEPSSTVTLPTTSDGGTVSGAGEYEIGATVTVTATPEAGFIFNGWYVNGELVSTDPTYTFVVNGDVTLTPEFTDVRTKLLIITHPADAELFADETAVFSVTASGDGLTYQWQQSSRTLARTVNWINIDGATLPTYQVEATVERDGTQYRCIVTDQYGNTLTSDAATLTVLENPVLPPTGDGFNAALWLALLAVSTVGVILLRKRVRG